MFYTKKQIFYINSKYKISGTDSNFYYGLNIDVTQDFDWVVLLKASIPKSYYLIQDGLNTFTLKENGFPVVITLPPGNYNRNSMKIILQDLLNAASPNLWTYTVTYDQPARSFDRGKYVFTVFENDSQPEFVFTHTLYEPLGFNSNSTNVFVDNVLISTNVINLSRENTIFLHSDICQNDTSDNVLQEIFTSDTTDYGYIFFNNINVESYAKKYIPGARAYNFYLTDEDANPINLNGLNINLTLMIFKENKIDSLIQKYIKLKTIDSVNIDNEDEEN